MTSPTLQQRRIIRQSADPDLAISERDAIGSAYVERYDIPIVLQAYTEGWQDCLRAHAITLAISTSRSSALPPYKVRTSPMASKRRG
jgi:hypothetical protein